MSDQNQIVLQAVLTPTDTLNPTQHTARLALFDEEGNAVEPMTEIPTGDDIELTGLTTGPVEAIASTDTVNEAMAKLQAQIDDLTTP